MEGGPSAELQEPHYDTECCGNYHYADTAAPNMLTTDSALLHCLEFLLRISPFCADFAAVIRCGLAPFNSWFLMQICIEKNMQRRSQ